MSRKFIYIAVSILIVLATVLSACAQATPTPQTIIETKIVEKEGETIVITATPQPTTPPPTEAPETITLNFTHMTWLEAGQKALDEAIAAFEAENPNIKIKQNVVSWGEAHSQFVTGLAAGVAPDIQMLGTPWNAEFYNMGALAAGDEYLPADFKDKFLPPALESVVFDGKTYGIPWEGADWGFFYRTDLFEQAGLDPTKPPKDWNELVEYAKKLTVDTNGDGKPEQWGVEMPAGGWESDDYFDQFMWQAGNPIAEADENGVWKSTIAEPSGVEALKFYYDLVNTHKVMPSDIVGKTWEDVKNDFVFGKVAMIYDGGWTVGTIDTTDPSVVGKWATAVTPAGPTGIQATLGYPNTLMVTAQSKHPAEAFKFLEFLQTGSPSWADTYCLAHSSFNWTKAYVETDFAKDPKIAPLAEALSFSHHKPYAPDYEKFRQGYFIPGLQSLLKGELTPEQAAQQFDEAFNKLHGAQ